MLAKIYRLPAKENFENSASISHQYFRILIKPNALQYNRFGFVISKKIDKRAVTRNRLRRVLSEVVKEMVQTNDQPGKDVLFIVKKNFIDISTQEISGVVRDLLNNRAIKQ